MVRIFLSLKFERFHRSLRNVFKLTRVDGVVSVHDWYELAMVDVFFGSTLDNQQMPDRAASTKALGRQGRLGIAGVFPSPPAQRFHVIEGRGEFQERILGHQMVGTSPSDMPMVISSVDSNCPGVRRQLIKEEGVPKGSDRKTPGLTMLRKVAFSRRARQNRHDACDACLRRCIAGSF